MPSAATPVTPSAAQPQPQTTPSRGARCGAGRRQATPSSLSAGGNCQRRRGARSDVAGENADHPVAGSGGQVPGSELRLQPGGRQGRGLSQAQRRSARARSKSRICIRCSNSPSRQNNLVTTQAQGQRRDDRAREQGDGDRSGPDRSEPRPRGDRGYGRHLQVRAQVHRHDGGQESARQHEASAST